MICLETISGTRWRALRRLVTACVLVTYLLAGAFHHICDLDVANLASEATVSLVAPHDDGRQGDETLGGAHHCHGCFTFAVSSPPTEGVSLEAVSSPVALPAGVRGGHAIGLDPPPPKALT